MKRTFKALLLIGLSILSAFTAIELQAQNSNQSDFEGAWVLDSVRVKEVVLDSIVEKTVLPGDVSEFNNNWMLQFTLRADGKASYTEIGNRTISGIPYSIENRNGNNATLIIDGVPDYKILSVQLLSKNAMLFTLSFSSGYEMKDIEVYWKMYYHKSN